ncbi:hypothetical protein F2Q68_00005128 [Brassica cretica]|uniref:Uncharacterized protein n=1 Tax=Brassica cretica TaxID=69181 RepID=A0A8S9JC14_BRACR|nr:hypothetical protein F2Q68_00005128 [Brassica cretica]
MVMLSFTFGLRVLILQIHLIDGFHLSFEIRQNIVFYLECSSSFPLFTFIFSKALMVAMFSVSRIASSGSATFWRTLVILELFEVQNCTDASDIAMDETLPRSDVMPDLLKSGMSASRDEAIEETIEMSIDGAPLVSIDGAPLVSIDGAPLVSIDGAPLVSIDGAPLVSIDSAPLVSIDGDDRMWAEYISIPT